MIKLGGRQAYQSDLAGNMLACRPGGLTTYTQTYDAENRLTAVSGGTAATFTYDGDGNRVKATVGGVTTVYIGSYEKSGATIKKYYYAGGTLVGMRQGTTMYWLFGDHLGGLNRVAYSTGGAAGQLRYKPWGENSFSNGTLPTTMRYTGQRQEASVGGGSGLYFYNARWYDPALGRFVSADTLVPEPGNPQSLNRFAYVLNSPLRFIDPTGHGNCEDMAWECEDGEWSASWGDETGDNQSPLFVVRDQMIQSPLGAEVWNLIESGPHVRADFWESSGGVNYTSNFIHTPDPGMHADQNYVAGTAAHELTHVLQRSTFDQMSVAILDSIEAEREAYLVGYTVTDQLSGNPDHRDELRALIVSFESAVEVIVPKSFVYWVVKKALPDCPYGCGWQNNLREMGFTQDAIDSIMDAAGLLNPSGH